MANFFVVEPLCLVHRIAHTSLSSLSPRREFHSFLLILSLSRGNDRLGSWREGGHSSASIWGDIVIMEQEFCGAYERHSEGV